MAKKTSSLKIGSEVIKPGETKDVFLKISETYTGTPIQIPIRVLRAKKAGPTIFLAGTLHGDELIGFGIIREFMTHPLNLKKGTLICMPVINIFGFENHNRYLPDRRDLNRCFPGSETGTLGNRMAYQIFTQVVKQSDMGIDLHSAATRRTNFPQVRVDFSIPKTKEMAFAFGCELVVNKKGPPNSLREAAGEIGCPTLLYEAGEVLKFEPGVVDLGLRGVKNILKYLGMLDGEPILPPYQTQVDKTSWVRSNNGGMLHFYVRPGDLVKEGDKIAICERLFFNQSETLTTPFDGIVLGMTTLPAVKPGEPVCHLAVPHHSLKDIRKKMKARPEALHRKIQKELATNIRLYKKRKK